MTAYARMIVTGKNRDIQPSPFTLCPECGGSGKDIHFYICPIEHVQKKHRVPCAYCEGSGVINKKLAVKGASAQLVGSSDFTSPWSELPLSSGMTPDDAAPADPAHHSEHTHNVLRSVPRSHSASHRPASVPPTAAPGTTLLDQLQDIVTFITAMIVFGGLFMFFWVIA